jgi:hypothetical protein
MSLIQSRYRARAQKPTTESGFRPGKIQGMRIYSLILLAVFTGCENGITDEEEDVLARIELSTDLTRDELHDFMTMCEAMLDCYEDTCPDDTDIRRHMPRAPLSDYGMRIALEFKNKGVRPMEKELALFLKDESLQRADWPCRDFFNQYSIRKRSENRK